MALVSLGKATIMPRKSPIIMPLAAALAALAGTAAIVADPADAKTTDQDVSNSPKAMQPGGMTPNRIVSVGGDFLGFIVTNKADGTVLAEHYSHTSHSSHSSHYSSR
jgi:hypothetical protein